MFQAFFVIIFTKKKTEKCCGRKGGPTVNVVNIKHSSESIGACSWGKLGFGEYKWLYDDHNRLVSTVTKRTAMQNGASTRVFFYFSVSPSSLPLLLWPTSRETPVTLQQLSRLQAKWTQRPPTDKQATTRITKDKTAEVQQDKGEDIQTRQRHFIDWL